MLYCINLKYRSQNERASLKKLDFPFYNDSGPVRRLRYNSLTTQKLAKLGHIVKIIVNI